jgi:hypothetical protein
MPHNERLIPMQWGHQMLPLGIIHGRIVSKKFLKKQNLRINLTKRRIQWRALVNMVPLKASFDQLLQYDCPFSQPVILLPTYT